MNDSKDSSGTRAGVGLLIDLTDEEKIPFPSQLMTAGEVDDTFGIFESKQTPVSLDGPSTVATNDDYCFQVPIPIAMSEKKFSGNNNDAVEERNERKSIRKSTIGGHQVLAGSASMLGLNDAFIRSTGSDSTTNGDVSLDSCGPVDNNSSSSISISSTSMTSDLNLTEKNIPDPDNSVFISPITRADDKSTKGNTSSDESGLLEVENVSTFTLSDSDITTTPSEPAKKSKLGSDLDIFDRVFKVSAFERPSNDAIAKKVQELFDAASPSKNPHLYNKGSNIRSPYMSTSGRHHFTPSRRSMVPIIPIEPESLYATPKRETPRQFTPIQREGSADEISFRTPLCPSTPSHSRQESNDTNPVRLFPPTGGEGDRLVASCPSKKQDFQKSQPSPSLKKFDVSNSRLPARLSFGSTSSSSGEEGPSTRKLVKATMGSAVSSVTRKIQSTQLAPKLRLAESERTSSSRKGPQPLKAMPMHQILPAAAGTSSPGCASAPVHRKFMAPIAASSPKVDTSFSSYEAGTPPRNKRLSNVRSSGYGQQVSHPKVMPESPNLMNTSTTRILPSSSRGIPSPSRNIPSPAGRSVLSQNALPSPGSGSKIRQAVTKAGGGIVTASPSSSTSTKENNPKFGFRRK